MNIDDNSIKQFIFDINDISQMFINSVNRYDILYCSDSNFDYDLHKVSKYIMSGLSYFDNKNSYYTFTIEPIDKLSLLKSSSLVYIAGKPYIQIGIFVFPSGKDNIEKYYKTFYNNDVSLSKLINSRKSYKKEWKVIYNYDDSDNIIVI